MKENDNFNKEKNVLLMLSGGRDSFLAACELIAKGYFVNMITYDNGYMTQVENAKIVADRIVKEFGQEHARFVGIYPIAQNIIPLLQKDLYSEPIELYKEYPHLLRYQLNCLACRTVMYLHSVAYCKATGIKYIAEGARKQQKFFVELEEMKQRYTKLCSSYEIELILPVFELDSDIKRKRELAEWRFCPKSYEPQCWLGCPVLEDLNEDQKKSLALYYDNEILKKADDIINNLIPKKRVQSTCPISEKSYE